MKKKKQRKRKEKKDSESFVDSWWPAYSLVGSNISRHSVTTTTFKRLKRRGIYDAPPSISYNAV